jgi:23S rRNA (guanosine2251-2'-O)-methyltransferase
MKNSYIIYGKHAVLAAISNPNRKILEIFCTPEIEKTIEFKKSFKITTTTSHELKQLTHDAPHQGIIARVAPISIYSLPKELLSSSKTKIIILDQITDPQNLGAIMRSAAAFGIDAIIYPRHGNVTENGTVAKAACGALDLVPLIEVVNISSAIAELKKEGFWVIGLDGSADHELKSSSNLFDGKLVAVLGAEGAGIRPLIAKNCDLLVKLPISPHMESLNVSNAAAIVMWEISKK